MATINERQNEKGTISHRVQIRRNNTNISKTFYCKEDAEVYAFYKERLISNMENFEVDIKDTVTTKSIFELKIASIAQIIDNKRELNDMESSLKRIGNYIDLDKCYSSTSLEEWIEAAKKIFKEPVYRGAKTEISRREMSPNTLRKIFAHASAAVSYAQSQGIAIENYPIKVIQSYIRGFLEK